MPATAQNFNITKDDLVGGIGGAFAELTVPGEYEATLSSVEDYDYTAKGKTKGWKFNFAIETPSGGSVTLSSHIAFTPESRWKLVGTLEALGSDLSEGVNSIDPNAYVGDKVGLLIDFPRNDDGEPISKYREIQDVFSLVELPPSEGVAAAGVVTADLAPF